MLAVMDTAHSRLALGPLPRCAVSRWSSSTVVPPRHGRSSTRTISWSRRAVERQCTLRRSSPCRYSRTIASSSPWPLRSRIEPSSPAPMPEPLGSPFNEVTLGTTTSLLRPASSRSYSTSPNGSVTRAISGPTCWMPRMTGLSG